MTSEADSTHALLTASPLGRSLNAPQITQLCDYATSETLRSCTTVFVEGDTADALRVISSGSVALDMHVPPRGSVRILTLGPGDVLGWSALVGDGHMSATATVLQEAKLIRIPAVKLLQLCDADAEFGRAVMHHVAKTLARRLQETRLQLLDLFADAQTGKATS
jgi:CRP/FNR family cyclic AMP-dependent transcriptional regulator